MIIAIRISCHVGQIKCHQKVEWTNEDVSHFCRRTYKLGTQQDCCVIVFEKLLSGWAGCVLKYEMRCIGNHLCLLPYQWIGVLVHWDWNECVRRWSVKSCALKGKKGTEWQLSHSVIVSYQPWWNKVWHHLVLKKLYLFLFIRFKKNLDSPSLKSIWMILSLSHYSG